MILPALQLLHLMLSSLGLASIGSQLRYTRVMEHISHMSKKHSHMHAAQTGFAGRQTVMCFPLIGHLCFANLHIAACKVDAGNRTYQRMLPQSLQRR